jgi:hypothetical protein
VDNVSSERGLGQQWGMRRAKLPDHLTTGSFSLRSSDKAGISRTRTAARDLVTVSRGIRVPLDSGAKGAAALRAYTDIDDTSILVAVSAARIWGHPLPSYRSNDWRIQVARRPGFSVPRRANVVGRLLTFLPDEVVEYDGVGVTSAARTWLDLASELKLPDLVAAGDFLACQHGAEFPYPKDAHCSTEELHRMVAKHPGMRGVRAARNALDLVRIGADSAPETFMRLALLDAGLPEPTLNLVVWGDAGQPVLWPDAAYPGLRIALQYDGEIHNNNGQYVRDIRRQETSASYGWLEVRVSKDDLQGERPAVVRKVLRALNSRGWSAR